MTFDIESDECVEAVRRDGRPPALPTSSGPEIVPLYELVCSLYWLVGLSIVMNLVGIGAILAILCGAQRR